MTAQTEHTNDWHRIMDEVPIEMQMVLRQTLPTPGMERLMNLYSRDIEERLKNLDVSREATEFKQKYIMLKLQSEFAESFLHFVKTLTI